MKPKLWVDYINHRGERRWREIEVLISTGMALYPPTAPSATWAVCLFVKLADRDATRTLALTSCQAFYQGNVPPKNKPVEWYDDMLATQLADKRTIKELQDVVRRMTGHSVTAHDQLSRFNRAADKIRTALVEIDTPSDDRAPMQATAVNTAAVATNEVPDEAPEDAPKEEMTVLDRLEAIEATLGI